MLDDQGGWPLVQIEDAYGARWVPAPAPPQPREHIRLSCTKCGTVATGSLFAIARNGGFPHRCRKPPRRRLVIW
jgi:hypothetical protein